MAMTMRVIPANGVLDETCGGAGGELDIGNLNRICRSSFWIEFRPFDDYFESAIGMN
jgi:hypothetical protein